MTSEISLKKNMMWNTIGCVFYQGCLWLTTVLVVRLSSGFDNSGILSLAMSLGNVYFAMSTYNIRAYQVSDVNEKYSNEQYISLRIITVFVSYVIFALYAAFTSSSWLVCLSILAYLVFKADESFCSVLYGIDQRHLRMDYIGKSQIMRGVILVGLFSGVLVLSNSLPIALFAMAASCFCITLLFDLRWSRKLGNVVSLFYFSKSELLLLRECFPSAISLIISGSIATSARQLFMWQYGEEALGIYATVATPSVLIQVLASNLYAPLLVPLATSFSKGNMTEAKRKVGKLVSLVVIVSVLISAALSMVGDSLLPLIFGDAITPYCYLLLPALLVASGVAFLNVISDCLVTIRCLRVSLLVNCIALLVTIGTFGPFVQAFYLNGLSFAQIAGYVLSSLVGLCILFYMLSSQYTRKNG